MAHNFNNTSYNNTQDTNSTTATTPVRNYEIYNPESHIIVPRPTQILKTGIIPNVVEIDGPPKLNVVYQVVCPDELNLKPDPKLLKPRDRLKNLKAKSSDAKQIKTRSGRTIKFSSKYNEFKRINSNNEPSRGMIQCDKAIQAEALTNEKTMDNLGTEKNIASRYTYPETNFELWHYLINISCKYAEKGKKFCQELSNLLHTLLAVKNLLFKETISGQNSEIVVVNEVLGKVLDLTPGLYYFDYSNIYNHNLIGVENSTAGTFRNENQSINAIDNSNLVYQQVIIDSASTEDQSIKQIENASRNSSATTPKAAKAIFSPDDFFSVEPDAFQSHNNSKIDETNKEKYDNPYSIDSFLSFESEISGNNTAATQNADFGKVSSNLSMNLDELTDYYSNYDHADLVSDFNAIFNNELDK